MVKHLATLINLDIHSVNFKKEEFHLLPEMFFQERPKTTHVMIRFKIKGLILGTWELLNEEVKILN